MRKRYRVLILAAFVAAVAVPFGFAFSVEPRPVVATTQTAVTASPFLFPTLQSLPDGAQLTLVGAALFGLAAAVRHRKR